MPLVGTTAPSTPTIRGLPRPLARALEGYAGRLDVEQIRAADPEMMLVAPCGYGLEHAAAAAEELLAAESWNWARARAVWAIDANRLLSRPGPGLVDGALTMAAIFHPGLFPAPDAARARNMTRD